VTRTQGGRWPRTCIALIATIMTAAALAIVAPTAASAAPIGAELSHVDGDAANVGFGAAVAASGNVVAVGDGSAGAHGQVSIYSIAGNTFTPKQTLTAADATEFGRAVAMNGTTLVIGDDAHSVSGNGSVGAVYIYTATRNFYTGAIQTFSLSEELTPPVGAALTMFGASVATDGKTVVVGAPGYAVGGAVFTYTRTSTAWPSTPSHVLQATDGTAGSQYGTSVALTSGVLVVGATGRNDLTGAAYIYTRSGSAFALSAEPAGHTAGDLFGFSVSALGTSTVAVGAIESGVPSHGPTGPGEVYLYTKTGKGWARSATFAPTVTGETLSYGWSTSLTSTGLLVGSPGDYNGSNAGAALLYQKNFLGQWALKATMTEPGQPTFDSFAKSVVLTGTLAVLGAPFHNNIGTAYLYQA
jgi:FG-GAP repeat